MSRRRVSIVFELRSGCGDVGYFRRGCSQRNLSISEDYHMGHLKLDDIIKFNEHSVGPKLLSYVTTFSRVLLARKEAERDNFL